MSITARTLSWLAGLLVIAFVLFGTLTVTTTRSAMIEQVDDVILEAVARPAESDPPDRSPPETHTGGRSVAILLYDADGTLTSALPSGFVGNPDPLPDMSDSTILLGDPGGLPEPVVVGSVGDSGMRYRAVTAPTPQGVVVAAASMAAVDDTTDAMIAALFAIGGIVVSIVLAGAWMAVSSGLRPVRDIAAVATSIAEGDLSVRTQHSEAAAEVGQLGAAFNHMAEEVQASMEVREATEMRLRRFVADASHELRTPLVSVRGYAELYRAGALTDPDKLSDAMSRVEGETKRMGRLIDDLLLLARLDQRRPLDLSQVDLAQLGRDAVADARAVEPDRPIEFVSDGDVSVVGDSDRLRQVFGNLLTNVRTHTTPDTPVRVEVAGDENTHRIVIADEGDGMDPEQATQVFDRFYRIDKARSRRRGGSGLGLSIVAAVAEAHGGKVIVDTAPGEGATFTVTIPRAQ